LADAAAQAAALNVKINLAWIEDAEFNRTTWPTSKRCSPRRRVCGHSPSSDLRQDLEPAWWPRRRARPRRRATQRSRRGAALEGD